VSEKMTNRLLYTETQVLQYFRRIDFPNGASLPMANLDTLRRLVAGHIYAIPWENVSLKYSETHDFGLDKDEIFDKIVSKRKGAVCLEANSAFATLLLTLGYNLYTLGTRIWVSANGAYLPLTHLAIILKLEGVEYLVDVGFGGTGLTAPLPIFDGKSAITAPIYGVVPEQHRIQMTSIPGALKKDHKVWTLQHRQNPQAEWTTIYSFEKDVEMLRCDLEMYGLSPILRF
jgi:arylamine N-acetyltransferase